MKVDREINNNKKKKKKLTLLVEVLPLVLVGLTVELYRKDIAVLQAGTLSFENTDEVNIALTSMVVNTFRF